MSNRKADLKIIETRLKHNSLKDAKCQQVCCDGFGETWKSIHVYVDFWNERFVYRVEITDGVLVYESENRGKAITYYDNLP